MPNALPWRYSTATKWDEMLPAFKNEIKGQPSCSTAIKVSKYGRIVDLLICYFTPFGDAHVAGLSEKKWQMNTCVCPSSSQSCLKMRLKWWKDQRMEREAKKSVVGYKWLDFSIWQINRKVIFPLKLAGQRCPPTVWQTYHQFHLGTSWCHPLPPKIWTEMTDSTIKW